MDVTCASCNKTMHSVLYRGVHVRFCLSCKSLFLKPGQLESILESEEGESTTEPRGTLPQGQNLIFYCPSCNVEMEKQDYGKIIKTPVHVCRECRHLWLDKNRLARIERDHEIVKQNTDTNRRGRITCPKCGHEQKQSDKCSRCGVYFEKIRSPRTVETARKKDQTLLEAVSQSLQNRISAFLEAKQQRVSVIRQFLDSLHQNVYASFFMRSAGWLLILVNVYLGWLILQYIFTHITTPPPRPTDFYSNLSNISLFYIFAIMLAGPVVLVITFLLWRVFWFTLYDPILMLTHRYFHPLVKPVIAIGLMLLVLQSAELFSRGFWTTWWWVDQQYSQAASHKLRR